MIDLLVLIFFCTAFTYVIQSRTVGYPVAKQGIKEDLQSRIVYYFIIIAFILFAGLRSKYNDTVTYVQGFELISTDQINLSTILESYGGFEVYQQLIKKYVSTDPQIFIFVTSVLTNLLYIPFIARHTKRMGESIFLYSIGSFLFCMAGLKQAIAIGISLYSIDAYLEKKYIKAIILLFLAMTFHPYIICLISIPFLKNKIWDGKTIVVIIIAVLALINLDRVIEIIGLFAKDYSNDTFNDYTINPIRVLVEAVPIVISWQYRNKISEENNIFLTLGINMKVISFLFIAMGLFVNPIYFGRMSSYFSALSSMVVPEMLHVCWRDSRYCKGLVLGYYIFFFAYFLMDMTKIGSISIFFDQFNHVPFSSLFVGKEIMY